MNHDELEDLLEKDPGWADPEGNSVLHHAARAGDAGLAGKCLERGVDALARNKDNECARDMARIWGYDDIAAMIDPEMKRARAATPPPPLAYASLGDIREKSAATGVNILHKLAARGLFDQVVLLAEKDPGGLTAEDLLEKGADGDSVILKICQQGQLPALARPELWANRLSVFLSVWETVPKIYQKDVDISAFLSRTRQMKLKSGALKKYEY